MGYKIGSFNLYNISHSALGKENVRDLKIIARIIKEEGFDVIAMQEILSEGKAFISPNYAKKSIITELGGENNWGFEWADAENNSENDRRGEGYAFIWNKKRLRLCNTKVITKYGEITRTFYPRMCSVNKEDMVRRPYYGRFTAMDVPGGANVEFRLICVHTYYGKTDSKEYREKRQHELDVLLKDIYPQIADRRYGDSMDAYTILLGDYNAELWTDESKKWQENLIRTRKPYVMKTDDPANGIVNSTRYGGRAIKTVQTELTTLKSKQNEMGIDEFDTGGFSCNYDHFSYEEATMKDARITSRRITRAVTKYCKLNNNDQYTSDFEKYYKIVSDHIPIVLEIEL